MGLAGCGACFVQFGVREWLHPATALMQARRTGHVVVCSFGPVRYDTAALDSSSEEMKHRSFVRTSSRPGSDQLYSRRGF